jgi:3-keto-5-aminohexanoate cleavage enzyme
MMSLPCSWNYTSPREYLRRVERQTFPPLIISVAITGGIHGCEVNPNLPEIPEAQAKATFEAYEAGASIVHVHARDPKSGYSKATGDPAIYFDINKRIRELCYDIIINNTTGGAPDMPMEERVRSLDAKPEMASLNMGAVTCRFRLKKRLPPFKGRDEDTVFDGVFYNTLRNIEDWARIMKERGIKPEMELYNAGMFGAVYNLIDQELIDFPPWLQFVMGYSGGILPTPENLLMMLRHVPEGSLVSVIGIGPHQLPLNTLAIIMGLHARVGLEDNVYYRKGELAKSNAQLVERIVRLAKEFGRRVATPREAREMLGLSQQPSCY